MDLKEATETKLAAWYGVNTWHTTHDSDSDRWYDFVDQYQQDHGNSVDEAALREHIRHKIGSEDDHLRRIIRDRVRDAVIILDFLKRTRRPPCP